MDNTKSSLHPVTEYFNSSVNFGVIQNLTYLEHAHVEYELLYILDGTVDIWVAGRRHTANAGDYVFLNSEAIHCYVSSPQAKTLVAGCHPGEVPQFTQLIRGCKAPLCVLRREQQPPSLGLAVQTLLQDANARENRVALAGYMNLMLSHVVAVLPAQPPALAQPPAALERVLIHMGNLPAGRVSVDSVAQATEVSKFYLSHLLNQKLGVSFNNYIAQMRVNAARRMLVQTNLPIQDISRRCGYGTARSFNRDFMLLGDMPPRAYRKQYQGGGMIDYTSPLIRGILTLRHGLQA